MGAVTPATPSCLASSFSPAAGRTRKTAASPWPGPSSGRKGQDGRVRPYQCRARPRHRAVGDPRNLRGSRTADRPQRAISDIEAEAWRGFAEHGVAPSLDALALHSPRHNPARPDAPLRHPLSRRLARQRGGRIAEWRAGEELEELVWLPLDAARQADIPTITRTILGELDQRLAFDPLLRPGGPVPFYRMVRSRFMREIT